MKITFNGRAKNDEGHFDGTGALVTIDFKDATEMEKYETHMEDELTGLVDFCIRENNEKYEEFYIQGVFFYQDKQDVKDAYNKAKKSL